MIDSSMQRGKQWLETLLHLAGFVANVNVDTPAELENCWLIIDETNLTPEQIQVLIGHGTVLDAIQYLANASLNLSQSEGQQASYTIELNGYRVRRQAEIRALAENAALEVRASGREVEIRSLSSAERRQVHTFLKDFADLETFSRGKEPHRHLVVRQQQSEPVL